MTRFFLSLTVLMALTGCSNKFKGDGDDPDAHDDGGDDGMGFGDDGGGDDGGEDGGDGGDDGDDADLYTDDDGDGFTEDEGDCDDTNPDVAPNQAEECDGLDNDCNGSIDDGAYDGQTFFLDNDGDGYGDPSNTTTECTQAANYVTNGDDCDDDDYTANPEGIEISWNGVDEDCDGDDVDLTECVEDAINATAEQMTEGLWAIQSYNDTYYETITGWGLPVADWVIDNQYMYLVEDSTKAVSHDQYSYTADFDLFVGMNDSAYTGSYFSTTSGDYYYEGPFWVDVEMDEIYSYLGIDYSTYCDAWVDPVPHTFEGTLDLTVNDTAQTVSGDAQFSSNRTALTAGDVNTQSVSGEAVCEITVIDAIIDQLGYGDTLGILDETFAETLTSLEETYEDTLEANIAEYCSAP